MENNKLTIEELKLIIANPFYCTNIHPSMAELHEPLISEEEWIKAGVKSIEENGAEEFLKLLIKNLNGGYVSN